MIARADTVSEDCILEIKKALKSLKKEMIVISIHDSERMEKAKKLLNRIRE